MFYLRKNLSIIFALILLLFVNFVGCGDYSNGQVDNTNQTYGQINFVDVGNGDCTIINLPDGKILMVDCGLNTNKNLSAITSVLKGFNAQQIDFLILTHPDADHVGGAKQIIKQFNVKTAFIPNIAKLQQFEQFNEVVKQLKATNCIINYSDCYQSISGQDYYIAFLSPLATDGQGYSYYSEFNALSEPSNSQINDLSPIMYIEYKGVRTVLTGDASSVQENLVLDNLATGFYDAVYGVNKIRLAHVEYLKLANHGDDGSCCERFLQLLSPKNAIVSCGANSNGYSSSTILARLGEINPTAKVFRTDVYGTIGVKIPSQQSYTTITQYKM